MASRRGSAYDLLESAAPPPEREPAGPPKRLQVVDAIASAISALKSYNVAGFCDRVGLPPHPDPSASPDTSKRLYVAARADNLLMPDLVKIATVVLDELDDPPLAKMVERCRVGGVSGPVRNLVFGSTAKPDLVLTDAISNDLALINPDEALIYDGGIPEQGLSWGALVAWFFPDDALVDEKAAGRHLFNRLATSLASDPERFLFRAYAARYRSGFDQPALLPQVWMHYDPRSGRRSPLNRQSDIAGWRVYFFVSPDRQELELINIVPIEGQAGFPWI